MTNTLALRLAALMGFLAVALGAFGATISGQALAVDGDMQVLI